MVENNAWIQICKQAMMIWSYMIYFGSRLSYPPGRAHPAVTTIKHIFQLSYTRVRTYLQQQQLAQLLHMRLILLEGDAFSLTRVPRRWSGRLAVTITRCRLACGDADEGAGVVGLVAFQTHVRQ